MQFEIRIATNTADLDRGEWDRLSANRSFASLDWYRMGEVVLTSTRHWYVLVYDGGENIGRATFWLSQHEQLPLSSAFERAAVRILFSIHPLLVCRSPLADWSGLILPEDDRRSDALRMICSCAADIAAKHHASFTAFDYLDSPVLTENWQTQHYSRQDIENPGTCLRLAYSSFDDFLHGLSKSASKDYRRHNNQASARNIQVDVLDRVTDPQSALPLIRAVESRHGSMPKPWTRALLEYGSRGRVSWLSARQDGRLVGCGMMLEDQGVYLATLLGLDYSVEYVYFQLMYTAIRHAIEQGGTALRAGSGAYSFKKHLGFCLEDNNHLFYSGRGLLFRQIGCMFGENHSD